jgi:protease II
MKTDDNLLLMHPDMDAGHGGVSGRISAVSGDGPIVCILVAIGGEGLG